MARTEAGVTVVESLPESEVLEGHHAPASIYLRPEHAGGAPLTIAAADAAELVGKPLADLHRHAVDEVYLVVTPGLRFAVETDQGEVMVDSPASVRVPAGTLHRFVVHEAKTSPCPFLGLLLGDA
jgi:mannose-6-phosphate isomerase-like protein (cupin superfamily)